MHLLFLQRHYQSQKIWCKVVKSWQTIIGYIKIKKIDDCKNIHSVNPLYLLIDHASGYIEEKGTNKYLVFDSTNENKELLKKYNNVWNGIRDKIKEISSGDEKNYAIMKKIHKS